MLLHIYFCAEWIDSKFKRNSKSNSKLLWKLEKENKKVFSLPSHFWPAGADGPVLTPRGPPLFFIPRGPLSLA